MIVSSAVLPHSPLLSPTVGKEKRHMLRGTLEAFRRVEEQFYTRQVETIVIMSPHAPMYVDAFSANMSEEYVGTLKTFGDHQTSVRVKADMLLLDRIQRTLRTEGDIPFTLTTSEELDYGMTIPIMLLKEHLPDVHIIPLAPSGMDAQAHVEFGRALRPILHESSRRVAFIASADLSHKLSDSSPGGSSVEGPAFDAAIRGKLQTLHIEALLSMDAEAVEAAGQCGYRPIMTLLGLLDGMNVAPNELCYEAPFGVGYLTELVELL